MNPILPLDVYASDVEAHVMPDGKLYLYGSQDVRGSLSYCSDVHHVYSTDNMTDFTDHGTAYRGTGADPTLYAPDAAYKDGKYYMYICGPSGSEMSVVSDTPYGPFGDPVPLNCADGTGIDPSVLVDDDGQAYYFWGQFSLNGAKLNPDMRTLDETSVVRNILTEEEHGFHEGSSIRKINGVYYMVYCDITRGRATCLSYATSPNPLGPYTKRGVLIDNTYCDPETWNNHGSVEMFNGQLYLFYHRSSRNSRTSRRVSAEKLTLNPDGTICEAEMTSQGPEGPVSAFETLEASRYCRIRCEGYLRDDERYPERLTNCRGTPYWPGCVEYRYLDFGDGASAVEIEVRGKGTIRVRQKDRSAAAVIPVDSEGGFSVLRGDAPFTGGVQPLRLFIESNEGLDIRSVRFIRQQG